MHYSAVRNPSIEVQRLVLDLWTYYVFDKSKIVIVGNGYGALGTILLEPAKYA
jgi:hypothetical protein